MTYEETKKEAARQTHQWIKDYPDHFTDIAKKLIQRHFKCEEDYDRLNEPVTESMPKGLIPTESELFDPFLFLVGSDQANPSLITGQNSIPMPVDPKQSRLIYYAALLCLHEARNGYVHITDGIWPKDSPFSLFKNPGQFFDECFGDKTAFIEAALTAVKADLEEVGNALSLMDKSSVKLSEFFIKYCEQDETYTSKAKEIHRKVKNNIIKDFPKPINKPEKNQTKLYDPQELKAFWPTLKQKYMPNLPNLQ